MEQSIRVITLGVLDLSRSRTFYSDGLGWSPVLDLDEVVFYGAGFGIVLGLWPLEELARDVGAELAQGASISLGHNVGSREEVHEVIERARGAGAAILKEPQDAPLFGGYQAYFADPDGYLWEIAFNPNLSVGDDGTIHFGSPESP